ncbi:MAG: chloride channel protein [Gloeomargarita sp. SKYBB_i_bin120]|nr:chloride channel protein [Gloeomargarita sp. SKYG98]MCS7292122.1 chloride channel protein [Gloeomargarita sp. SKYB120]MDW8177683.1 chloride channel protein [Gloeomargarita sp. SKYBB_i_bin120]
MATTSERAQRGWEGLPFSPEVLLLTLAALMGGGTGLCVVAFRLAIAAIHWSAFEILMGWIGGWGTWSLALVPVLGGALVGLLTWWARDWPVVSVRAQLWRLGLAALSLGMGASLGPEAPSVDLGVYWGRNLGQRLRVSQERYLVLQAAGAAAGLAAGFNAPIAGAFFAFEVVLGTTFTGSAVPLVLLAAVVGGLVAQAGLGAQPAFSLPPYEVRTVLELPLYLGLGVLASGLAILYTASLGELRPGRLRGIPSWLQPMLGGLVIGAVALVLPQTLGIGYEVIEAMLQDVHFPLGLLLTLLPVKLALTVVSYATGWVGGLFAPALFLGAVLGSAYGQVAGQVLATAHIHIADPPAYAMVGMAALLACSTRAPLTAILLLFELTRNYLIILPAMAAVGLSIWLLDQVYPHGAPIGLHSLDREEQRFLADLRVMDAMIPPPLLVPPERSLGKVAQMLMENQQHTALVVNAQRELVGLLTPQDIQRAIRTHGPLWYSVPVGEWCTRELQTIYPDQSLEQARQRMLMRGLCQLPVVSRGKTQQVIGLLEKDRIETIQKLALTQRVLAQNLNLLNGHGAAVESPNSIKS